MKTRTYTTLVPTDRVVQVLPENHKRLGYILCCNSYTSGVTGQKRFAYLHTVPNPMDPRAGFLMYNGWFGSNFFDLAWPYTGPLYAIGVSEDGSAVYISVVEWSED